LKNEPKENKEQSIEMVKTQNIGHVVQNPVRIMTCSLFFFPGWYLFQTNLYSYEPMQVVRMCFLTSTLVDNESAIGDSLWEPKTVCGTSVQAFVKPPVVKSFVVPFTMLVVPR
jgi:hypothetical protein